MARTRPNSSSVTTPSAAESSSALRSRASRSKLRSRSWYSTSRDRRSDSSVAGAPSHSIASASASTAISSPPAATSGIGAAFAQFGEGLRVAAAEHALEAVGGAKLGEVAVAGEFEQRAVEVERLAAAQHHRADRQQVEQRFRIGAGDAGGDRRRLDGERRGEVEEVARRAVVAVARQARAERAGDFAEGVAFVAGEFDVVVAAAARFVGGGERRHRAGADRHDIGRGGRRGRAQHDDFGAAFGRRRRSDRRRGRRRRDVLRGLERRFSRGFGRRGSAGASAGGALGSPGAA